MTLTQGRFEGQPFRLHSWENWFIRRAVCTDSDAALSLGRDSGHSTLIAGICCPALDGPLAVPHSETIGAVSSFDQGTIVYAHVKTFMGNKFQD